MNTTKKASKIYSNEHIEGCPLRYDDKEYLPPVMKDWENEEFYDIESDGEGGKTGGPKYQNWGARACAHRGHCVGVEERGILCRDNDLYQQQARPVSIAERFLQEYMAPYGGEMSGPRIEIKHVYGEKGDEVIRRKTLRPKRMSPNFRNVQSPLVYHSAVDAEMPPELLQYQSITPRKAAQEIFDPSKRFNGFPEPIPTLSKLNGSESLKKVKKNKSATRKLATPKWKKMYIDTVRNYQKEKVGLIVVGPDGPEFYAKLTKSEALGRNLPAKISASLSALRTEGFEMAEKIDGGDNIVLPIILDDGCSGDTKREDENVENSIKLEGEGDTEGAQNNNEDSWRTEEDTQRTYRKDSDRRVASKLSDRLSKLKNPKTKMEKESPTGVEKAIYRAKKFSSKFGKTLIPSPKSTVAENPVDKVPTSIPTSARTCTSIPESENCPEVQGKELSSTGSHLGKQNELPLPSLGKPEQDRLSRLKSLIRDYASYLQEKAQREDLAPNFESCVSIEASKIIDALDHPLKPLSSDVTASITQVVTDTLIATDKDGDKEEHFFRYLLKLREEKFRKAAEDFKDLQEFCRVMDAVGFFKPRE